MPLTQEFEWHDKCLRFFVIPTAANVERSINCSSFSWLFLRPPENSETHLMNTICSFVVVLFKLYLTRIPGKEIDYLILCICIFSMHSIVYFLNIDNFKMQYFRL